MTTQKKMTKKQKEAAVEAAFYRHGHGVQIPIMSLSKVSAAAVAAWDAGEDLDVAMKNAIELHRVKQ
jgi:predicted phosphohydrolase